MIINPKVLSLPPYISTSWHNVAAIRVAQNVLMITLETGETIQIPDLKPEIVESIFVTHAKHIEQEHSQQQSISDRLSGLFPPGLIGEGDVAFRFGLGGIEGMMGAPLQHNQEQAHMPDLPQEMLIKIASIAKIVAPDDPNALPKAEPHCNCMHCQISRTIQQEIEAQEDADAIANEEVPDEELQFSQWHIEKAGEKLFTVINKLDTAEKYNVFLGHPVGCTCGKEGCEHILAVLND